MAPRDRHPRTESHQHIESQTLTHTDTQTHRHTDTQTHRHTDTQTHRHADTQTHRHTDTDTDTDTDTHTAVGAARFVCWAEAHIKIARMTLTIKLDRNWNSFQIANSAPPLRVTDSAIALSARITSIGVHQQL